MTFHVPEQSRVTTGTLGTSPSDGCNGAFLIGRGLRVLCSDGAEWEHVSVSLADRCPTWEEMCFVKSLFWDADDCVVQYHPAESEYVNNHPYCLHLWRPIGVALPVPPSLLVGIKDAGVIVS